MRCARKRRREGGAEAASILFFSFDDPLPTSSQQVLPNAPALLAALPSATAYEKSYMHRDTVTHVAAAPGASFFVTASCDGHVKFWKKVAPPPPASTGGGAAAGAAPQTHTGGIEFAKHYRAHVGPVEGLAVSADGGLAASWDAGGSVKVFDVAAFDMCAMFKLPPASAPSATEWVGASADGGGLLAVGDGSGGVCVYAATDSNGDGAPAVRARRSPALSGGAAIVALRWLPVARTLVIGDARGVLDYWRPSVESRGGGDAAAAPSADDADDGWPTDATTFTLKSDSDLYALAVAGAVPLSITSPPSGAKFAVVGSDARVRVFTFASGRLSATYDESPDAAAALHTASAPRPTAPTHLDAVDFGRRLAVERDVWRDAAATPRARGAPRPTVAFDDSGAFLAIPSLHGIKLVNTVTHRLAALLGRDDGARFVGAALFQGAPRGAAGRVRAAAAVDAASADPTLLATAYNSARFYVFTRRGPDESGGEVGGRDALNEKPRPEDVLLAASGGGGGATTTATTAPSSPPPTRATLHTSLGDIVVALFPDNAPLAVENFTTHGKNGYYDGTTFHRVIKGFMIQGGDPTATGSGGESIWGRPFEDEIGVRKHDKAFTLSMANAGPKTNGSQFFVTTVPTPWLDGKHTVFGRVVRGGDVVQAIEKVRTGKSDKPVEDVSIVSVTVGGE